MVRSVFGSPFQNTNSGINLDDRENNNRLKQALQNWWKSTDEEYKAQFKNTVCPDKLAVVKYGGPLLGLAIGRFYTDAFCSPRYIYMRTFIMFWTTLAGYKYSTSLQDKYNYSFYTKNFHLFPEEVQNAVRSSDARYLHKYQN